MKKLSLIVVILLLLSSAPVYAENEYKNVDSSAALENTVDVYNGKTRRMEFDKQGYDEGLVDRSEDGRSIPRRYNSKDLGYVTYVKDQADTDNCWAYSAMSTLESALLRMGLAEKKNLRLSERHLAYFTYEPDRKRKKRAKSRFAAGDRFYMLGEDGPYYEGGSMEYYVATLARRVGAVDNSTVAGLWDIPSKHYSRSHVHLKSARFLPRLANLDFQTDEKGRELVEYKGSYSRHRDIAKRHIMRYGSINLSYYSAPKYYNSEHQSHYFYEEGLKWRDPDHDVAVVGWDDDFSKYNFNKTARRDGAWIVKNSWGKDFGDKGYMYLSYWDKSIFDPTALIPEKEEYRGRKTKHKNNIIYQYDGVRFGDGKFCTSLPVYGANMFKARSKFKLTALGISTFKPNTKVWIGINKNAKYGKPFSGKKVFSKTYTIKYPGYNTIKLPKSIKIGKGKRFTIRCRMQSKSGKWYYMPFETQELNLPYREKNAKIEVSKGQSFVRWGYKKNGKLKYAKWRDVTKQKKIRKGRYKIGNAVIKAIGRSY